MLKRIVQVLLLSYALPAAFRRLCVETNKDDLIKLKQWPASFGRLCVETNTTNSIEYDGRPASFGRLCVETNTTNSIEYDGRPAAFRRLCVETPSGIGRLGIIFQPPSGGCVLKL